MVELSDLGPEGQNLAFQINMAGPIRRRVEQRKEAVSSKRPQDEHEPEQQHVTEEQVRHIRNQIPASNRLLEKYQYQYKLRQLAFVLRLFARNGLPFLLVMAVHRSHHVDLECQILALGSEV